MLQFKQIELADVEGREAQLILFACLAVAILAAGLALLMYPAVFTSQAPSSYRTPQIAFFGFCGLSCLLVLYIVDRQFTIQGLRHQIEIDRTRALEVSKQATADLLGILPTFKTFEDRLSMEFRRAATAELTLSVLVVAVKSRPDVSEPNLAMSALGNAAKAISRKQRQQDSIYLLSPGVFGVILPGVDTLAARQVSSRFSEGLSDAANANDCLSFKINVINYPEHATSLHDLELAVSECLPEVDLKQNVMRETHRYR